MDKQIYLSNKNFPLQLTFNLHVFSFMATYFRSMILIRTAQAKIAPRGGIHLG